MNASINSNKQSAFHRITPPFYFICLVSKVFYFSTPVSLHCGITSPSSEMQPDNQGDALSVTILQVAGFARLSHSLSSEKHMTLLGRSFEVLYTSICSAMQLVKNPFALKDFFKVHSYCENLRHAAALIIGLPIGREGKKMCQRDRSLMFGNGQIKLFMACR